MKRKCTMSGTASGIKIAPQDPFTRNNDTILSGELAEPDVLLPRRNELDTTSPSAPQQGAELDSGPLHISSHQEKVSRIATELYTISYLIFFSMMGTLARLGLQALTSYPGAPVRTGVFWANFGGCLIMGFLTQDRKLFGQNQEQSGSSRNAKRRDDERGGPSGQTNQQLDRNGVTPAGHMYGVKASIPLYIGLATGFCGSFTSFSAFIRDAFLAMSNSLPSPVSEDSHTVGVPEPSVRRHPAYGVLAVVAVIIPTPMISLGALQIGAHIAFALEPIIPSISLPFVRRLVDRAMLFVGWLTWLGAIFMTVWPPDRPGASVGQVTWAHETWRGDSLFALVFAPAGCLLRFYASIHLNHRLPFFPPGTFAVNMAGTALMAILFDLQHVPMGNHVHCQVLQGLMDGFCGSLTTVSTWVVEIKGLRLKHAYFYGLMSVGVGLGLAIAIMGSLRWTAGFQTPSCGH